MARFSIQIAAQIATDANGVPYGDYLIPEPSDWDRKYDELKVLGKRPRIDIGTDPDAVPPSPAKALSLARGKAPISIEVSDVLLKHLQTDKKNLLIFGITEIKPASEDAPKVTKKT
jgi:hypothetical protein